VLIADANSGWTQHQTVRVADAVRDVHVYNEQPCASYEECLAVREHTNRPLSLDEVIDCVEMAIRWYTGRAEDECACQARSCCPLSLWLLACCFDPSGF